MSDDKIYADASQPATLRFGAKSIDCSLYTGRACGDIASSLARIPSGQAIRKAAILRRFDELDR